VTVLENLLSKLWIDDHPLLLLTGARTARISSETERSARGAVTPHAWSLLRASVRALCVEQACMKSRQASCRRDASMKCCST